MRIKSGQDLATGLLFIAVGIAAIWIGADYPMGTPQRPGTGVLPRILAWCLIGTGGLLLIKSISTPGGHITGWAWRPLLAVTLLILNNQTRWVGERFRNGWSINAVLALTVLLFAYVGYLQLTGQMISTGG